MAYLDLSNRGLVLRRPSAFSSESFLLAGDLSATQHSSIIILLMVVFSVAMFGMNFPRYEINPGNVFSSLAFSGGFISFTALISSGSRFKPSLLKTWPT